MSTVTIVLTDKDGGVDFSVSFQPKPDWNITPAQEMAAQILEFISRSDEFEVDHDTAKVTACDKNGQQIL